MTQADQPEAQVVSVDASGRKRTHFAGLLTDAKAYVLNNFPRLHVEPGSNNDPRADVFVTTRDGSNVAYHGAGSGGDEGWHDVDERGNVVESSSTVDDDVDPTTVEA